jgi:hypothetical protein
MGRQVAYTDGISTVNLGDLFNINGISLIVKELFVLNRETYISYEVENELSLKIELANKFIEEKREYFNTVVSNPQKDLTCGSCEG